METFTATSPKMTLPCFTSLLMRLVLVCSALSRDIGCETNMWTSVHPSTYFHKMSSGDVFGNRPAPSGIPLTSRGSFLKTPCGTVLSPYTGTNLMFNRKHATLASPFAAAFSVISAASRELTMKGDDVAIIADDCAEYPQQLVLSRQT